jgi:hypothetical protein
MGTLSFNRRFRNIAVDPSRMVFKEEYVRGGYEPTTKNVVPRLSGPRTSRSGTTTRLARYSGFDPAVGQGFTERQVLRAHDPSVSAPAGSTNAACGSSTSTATR